MNTIPPLVKCLTSFFSWQQCRRHLNLLLVIGSASFGSLESSVAATYYWDINGTNIGATDNTVASGTWNTTTANWTTNSAGTAATGAQTTTNEDVIFSAGTNATGISNIVVSMTDAEGARTLTVQEGTVNFSGSVLTLRGDAVTTVTLGASAGGNLTFGNGILISSASNSQTFLNQNATGAIVFNGKIKNNSGAFTLTLSASSGGGITLNAVLGEERLTVTPTALAVVVNSSGTGVTTFNAVNVYTGSTTVSAGTLLIGGSGSINGTSGVSLNGASALLRYDSSVALTKTVTFGAGGTFLYNSAAKYTGGSGSISADSGDTIGGNGGLGNVTIASGGTLTPGSLGNGDTGQLTVDSLTLQTGAQSQFDIASAVLFDSINSTGTKTLAGSLQLNFGSLLADGSVIDLFTGGTAGSLTGNFDSISAAGSYAGSFALVGGIYQLDTGTQLLSFDHVTGELSFSAIPEPSTVLLAVTGLMATLFLRRRRQGKMGN